MTIDNKMKVESLLGHRREQYFWDAIYIEMTWKVNDGSLLRMHAWWAHTSHILLFPMLSSENSHKMPLTFYEPA
jgi:hypothetical protein